MRIAFSGTGFIGHLVPMFPLMQAFVAAGHEVAVITSAEMEPFIRREASRSIVVLPAGPPGGDTMRAMARRLGASPATNPVPEVIAEFFAGQQIDAGFETALRHTSAWLPDVVISESMDFIGCLVAASLAIPHYGHTFGPNRPRELTDRLESVAAQRASGIGVTPAKTEAVIDVFPAVLQDPDIAAVGRRIALRPEIHGSAVRATALRPEAQQPSRKVLVTFGTVFTDPDLRERVADSIDGSQWHTVITVGADPREPLPTSSPTRRYVPFTPLVELLPGSDVIVTAGGAGTVLSSLIAGIPMVILPQGADHDINAARARAAGVALAADDPDAVGDAVERVISDPAYRARSRRIAGYMSTLPSAEEVALLLEREVLEHHGHPRY
jgi:UDP:flavonoid glycosyltransferase YjiC (YdhE family)